MGRLEAYRKFGIELQQQQPAGAGFKTFFAMDGRPNMVLHILSEAVKNCQVHIWQVPECIRYLLFSHNLVLVSLVIRPIMQANRVIQYALNMMSKSWNGRQI